MARLSRGCLRCRQRGVRCDEGRPLCQRCIKRNEVCEGYRNNASIIFQNETDKVIKHVRASQALPPPSSKASSQLSARKRSRSVDAASIPGQIVDPSALAPGEATGIKLGNPRPWLKGLPSEMMPLVEEQAVDNFEEKYVIYPCNQTSSPGFLEHLPCMFQEVNVHGRYALRWVVRAAAYAGLAKDQDSDILARKALQCYGMALSALGDSLGMPGKATDDYDLMTIVVLDIFETLYTPEVAAKGSHAQGMAQILRLPDLEPAACGITDMIQLHPDIWMAYEWNYHRAARITFLEQLLKCSRAALETPDLDSGEDKTLTDTIAECTSIIRWLADEVLSTVPQSLGE
ncbi:Transcriptional regulatory protein [Lachnellula subtilissima]|uniref:Transcriptional regulatory protein n=1 Tax=Lachnellula subtilissima TaxID=602034 RepID=A0A8H8RFW3_9HELO|nr:Transcriptional regulatory protein [Lachnellula subtilissima]